MANIVDGRRTGMRWQVVVLLMLVMGINYLDRSNISIAAPTIQKQFGLDAVMLGYLLSAFGWTYTVLLPFAGVVLDRVGARLLYAVAIVGWSLATFAVGLAGSFAGLLGCRVAVGVFESPALPTNVRCVTHWFPAQERALAVGLYTAMQYAGPAFLTPVLAWTLVTFGWKEVFYITGGGGLIAALIWYVLYRDPGQSKANAAELSYIQQSGGSDLAKTQTGAALPFWDAAKALLSHRQVWGMFIGQFSVQTTLFFFLTWFPAYLINGKHLTILKTGFYAPVPFIAAILGCLVAGKWSDIMVNHARWSSQARKAPIILGFVLSAAIMGANYTNSINIVLLFMSIAFFGQAVASTVTGALLSDIAPHGAVGTLGGLLYFVANVGGTSAPIVVGYIVGNTGGFNLALVYVSIVAMAGVLSYLFLMGPVYRIEMPPAKPAGD